MASGKEMKFVIAEVPRYGMKPFHRLPILFLVLSVSAYNTCAVFCRNVTILAAIPELVARGMGPSAPKENAAVALASTRHMAQGVAAPADSVTLKSTAAESLQSAR